MIKEGLIIKIYIPRNNIKKYYESKGYIVAKVGAYIEINAKDLSPGSHEKINYICDYCGKEFSRVVYSNERSKKGKNLKDACEKCCRTKRTKETSLDKYGVDNPMKMSEIQLKCLESHTNFSEGKNYSASRFEKGIPVSTALDNIASIFPDFEINYHYLNYYIDLVKDNIAIEYDGRGHNLGVRMGKISFEDFLKKEKLKTLEILKKFRLLRIIDNKDKLKKLININKCNLKLQIDNFIKSDELYKEIVIN